MDIKQLSCSVNTRRGEAAAVIAGGRDRESRAIPLFITILVPFKLEIRCSPVKI